MQVASTAQFRKAVRTVAHNMGVRLGTHSYTERNRESFSATRWVGLQLYGVWDNPQRAQLVCQHTEYMLNSQGLTAKSRITGSTNYTYIRGTCEITRK